jgi:hypothetical protein
LRRSQAVGGKIGIPLLIKRQDEPFFLNIAVSVDYFGAACLKGKVTSIAIRYISDQAHKILAEPHTWGPMLNGLVMPGWTSSGRGVYINTSDQRRFGDSLKCLCQTDGVYLLFVISNIHFS